MLAEEASLVAFVCRQLLIALLSKDTDVQCLFHIGIYHEGCITVIASVASVNSLMCYTLHRRVSVQTGSQQPLCYLIVRHSFDAASSDVELVLFPQGTQPTNPCIISVNIREDTYINCTRAHISEFDLIVEEFRLRNADAEPHPAEPNDVCRTRAEILIQIRTIM